MAFPKPEDQRNSRRMAIQFKPRDYERLATFARVTGTLPAVAARDIILQYLDARQDDVAELEKATNAYHAALKKFGNGTISLFPEYDNEEAK